MAEFFIVRYRKLFYCGADTPVRERLRTFPDTRDTPANPPLRAADIHANLKRLRKAQPKIGNAVRPKRVSLPFRECESFSRDAYESVGAKRRLKRMARNGHNYPAPGRGAAPNRL